MHKKSSSYDIHNKSDFHNSIPFLSPFSPMIDLNKNDNLSNELSHGIHHLAKKRKRRSKRVLLGDIRQLNNNQLLTNRKLDMITKILLAQFPMYGNNKTIPIQVTNQKKRFKKSAFAFTISDKDDCHKRRKNDPSMRECEEEIFDYFSFKLKPDLSFVSEGENKDKFIQPDRLISLKFLEDTEMFTKNNLSTNNFNRLTSNPFTQSSNKSDGEIKQINAGINLNKFKIPSKSGNNKENHDINSTSSVFKDDGSLVNYDDDKKSQFMEVLNIQELKDNMKDNIKLAEDEISNNNFTVSNNTSQSDISSSLQSSSNNDGPGVAKSSQDRFRKVRGFNFKNNIKTKKFSKGLGLNSEDKSANPNKYIDLKKFQLKMEETNTIKEINENTPNDSSNQKKPK